MNTIEQIYWNQWIILTEELHQEAKEILNADLPKETKYSHFTKKIRSLVKNGESTGLTDDKPKKGSSRAVHFLEEPHKCKIDGVETSMPTVLKVAFHGTLDKYLPKDTALLGEEQNSHESTTSHYHGVVSSRGNHDGSDFKFDPNGFAPPLIDHASDYSWIHVGKVDPIDAKTFKSLTKTDKFPQGITHDQFYHALEHHADQAMGLWDSKVP
jgi:hypothetical protein